LIARIPLGTVSPENVIDPTAVIVAPRNFGTIEIFGIDYSLAYHVDDDWTVEGSYSFVNKNYFENLDGVADLALNAPIHKGALSLRYFDAPSGLSAEVRTRWMGGFRMNSGVYYGNVDPYTLIDVTAGSRIPGYQHFALTLSVANLLDHRHYEFIGAPEIGLLMMGRVAYTL
jgi:iron complex outermembrane receptor protein